MAAQQYKTEPVKTWARMKELRRGRFRNNWEARSRGDLVIAGMHMANRAIPAGFGTGYYADMSLNPYWTGIMRNPEEVRKVLKFTDSKGYGPQICGALRIHLAYILQDLTTISPSGERIIPDFVYQSVFCPQVGRIGKVLAERLKIPYIYIDLTMGHSPKTDEYMLSQYQETIERMKKVTGKEYDDEKLVEGTKNDLQCMSLLSQIYELNKAIPAPLEGRQLASLNLPATTLSWRKEAVEYFRELLDEVKYRVDNQISANGFERKRVLMDVFPWVSPRLGRYPDAYGAVVVAGDFPFLHAQFEVDSDGHWTAPKGIDELCNSIRTREDALRAHIEIQGRGLKHHGNQNWQVERTAEDQVRMAEEWHCDGMILALNRDCCQQNVFAPETMLAAKARGMPVTLYHGVMSDIRQFSEEATRKQFDTFFEEGLGLTKIS